jgi:hypothetical protein
VSEYLKLSTGRSRFNLILGLMACGLAMLFGGVAASAASAEDDVTTPGEELPLEDAAELRCNGKITKGTDSDYPLNYEIRCNKDLLGYSIISNREIDATTTEPIGFEPSGDAALGEDFFCKAGIPGWGLGCYGAKGTAKLTTGNFVRAGISTFSPLCDANMQPMFWMVAMYTYSEDKFGTIASWTATSDPILMNSSAIRCKVLNPKAKAREACAKVKRAKGSKAKKAAADKCRKAQAAVRASN